MAGKVKIGLVQMSMHAEKEKNIARAEALARKAARKGAKIICFPELFATTYFPQKKKDKKAFELAEPVPGKTTKRMASLAKELKAVLIVPLYEKSNEKYYNTISVISERGKLLGKYRKMHIPHDPLFWEKNYFEEGNLGYKVFKTKYGKIAPLICFDQWFPEAARVATLKGADIIFYPTAIGWMRKEKHEDNWLEAWVAVQRAHAIANGIFVAAVNRVGNEDKLSFWGNSFVCDSFGAMLKQAHSKEEVLVQQVDLSKNKRIREAWGFFSNRRPESYGALNARKKRR